MNAKITVYIDKSTLDFTVFVICWYYISSFRNSNSISHSNSSNWPLPEFLWNWQQRTVSGEMFGAVSRSATRAWKEDRLARLSH